MKITRKINKRWLLTGLLAASAVVALLGPDFSGKLRSHLEWVYVPMGDPAMWLATTVRSGFSNGSDKAARQKINALEQELAETKRKLDEFWSQYNGEREFRELYGLSMDSPIELIPARVVSADSLTYGSTRLLNIGKRRGVMPGLKVTERIILTNQKEPMRNDLMAVTRSSLAGQIIQAGPFTAKLQLVTDPGFKMRGWIERELIEGRTFISTESGNAGERYLNERNNYPVPANAQGDGKGGLVIRNISDEYRIITGDRLITTDDDALLPMRIRVGTVSKVEKDSRHPGFVIITVKPDVDTDSLRYVYVVVSKAGRFLEKTVNGGRD